MPAHKLKPQHRKFVDELLKNPQSATAAAIAAGYRPGTAGQTAYDLQQRPDVAAELERRSTKALTLADASVERIVRELAALGFSDLSTIMAEDGTLKPVSQWPKEITVCIASMEFDSTEANVQVVTGGKSDG
jgi:phage terminase small subunit